MIDYGIHFITDKPDKCFLDIDRHTVSKIPDIQGTLSEEIGENMGKDYSNHFCLECNTLWNDKCKHCQDCIKNHPDRLISSDDCEER